ncbi:eukaryotic translation initiation factor 2b, epsilon subunit, putative [Ricinus communis]|uniref:Translation initiation factor eIF2B subunit epsilon n=1 Tax=Ricinus communis TaxID=3988 RepID=B9REW1_RICCO|nr:eukaryotic translation initiation factor 2b, epsilon subunit, putative [Ricinus communis]
MGYKIFTYEIHSSYAARIDNYRSYDTISKDIIQRWTYPFVPEVNFFGNCATKVERGGMYRASEIEQSRSAQIGPFTVVGKGTRIGNNSKISNSVIGKGCVIGSDVLIVGSYIWDDVTIEDGCELRHAIVCDGVIIKSGAVLEPGVVLSFKVVIGQEFIVPAYSKVSLFQQPTVQDSDEELEYADNNKHLMEFIMQINTFVHLLITSYAYQLGPGGVGYVWSISEGGQEDEWRHSVAPIPAEKLAEAMKAIEDDWELLNLDGNALPPSGELKADSNSNDSEGDDDSRDDSFEKEVEATFLRAVHENIKVGDIILEMNSLRLSYNMTSADCAGAIFYAMMKLAVETPHAAAAELCKKVTNVLDTWQKLLKFYAKEIDDQIEVILKFEEMCLESAKEFSPIFTQILNILYEKDIVEEDAILRWADEKKDAEESDKVFVKQSEKYIQFLL